MSSEVYIPNFSYPLSNYDTAEKYDTALDGIASGNYLFTKDGLWHGGIHFTGAALPDAKKGVQCIADGEVVAYRVNKDYLQNEEDKNTEKGFYSTGFVLVKHKMQYPSDEKALTFFSLYMHIGKLNYMVTTDGAVVRDAQYKETEKLSKGTMLLLDETEIKYPGHESYPRYKILSINGKELSDTRSIYTGTVTKLELDKTVVPSPPIAVKASQTIAPIGEYNLAGGENRKLLHLEVFTGDDFKAFVEKAKEKYPQDKPENKPSPTNVEVPKEKKLYLKTERCKLSQDANIREGFSNTSEIYKNKATTKETTIELDPSASQKVGKYTRVLVTKIGNEDVTGKGLTVIDSVFKDKEVIFTPLEVTTLLKRFKMADLKKEKDSSNIEYMLYDKDAKQYVKYSDCKEQHPVTFEWAEIIEVKSNDFVSIYDDIEKLFIKEMQRDLKLSDSYKELFELIDKNSDHKLDPLELSNAAKDKVLKETASKFIVQHSSEWDEEVNMAKVFIDIVEKLKDKLTDAETLKKHYKAEQARIEKLAFFKDCKSIDGFPKDHLVYHINPIGMVTEFGRDDDCITNWTKGFHRKIDGQNTYSEYIAQASKKYDIPCKILKSLIAQESGFDPKAHNNVGYAGLTQVGKTEWTSKSGVNGSVGTTTKTNGQYIYDMKNDERFDPKKSIFGGAKILDRKRNSINHLITDVAKYTDEEKWKFYLAAYNGGEGVVSQAYEELGKQNAKWEDLAKETAWTNATFKTARDKIDKYYKKHGNTLRTDVQWTSIKNTTKYSPLLVSLLYQTWGGKAKYDEVSGYVENIIARKNQ